MNYKGRELSCTEEELQSFLEGLTVMKQIYNFTEKFNGYSIDNPTGDENARYYVLQVGDRVFLQPHAPFEMGMVPITEENAARYIERHANELIDMIIFEKFGIQPENAVEILTRKNADLQALIDDLKQRNSLMQDDQLYILETLTDAGLI